jgi:hypothetical protein
VPNIQSRSIQVDIYYTKEKSDLCHELQPKSFHLYHFQVRNFLQNFVDEFDIIVLTETHLDNNIENRDIELDSWTS